ncbi:MAG: DUF4912 domain-containing protein [Leptolyngbya sp. SIO3F4]|nr:DUF4912 domain-containing protein [Leptolyngbya sp. SIO3F4]
MYRKMSLVKFAALFVAAATVSQLSGEYFSHNVVLAQSFGENPNTFPIPGSLPDGTTLKVDGSTSMRLTNEELERRFEEQYSNVDVELDASRTDEAFKALIEGDIDLLATGRPLTEEEESQGLVVVPLEQREKLAIVVGPGNSFEGDLTFDQFASIFRGEITNWSEVGGVDLPIRFVDRPDYSDTRRALSTYTVFEGKPFETGATVDPINDDETDSVVNALGNDGIGYSVVSQVLDRDDVRIIPMHQTLPDDPRYPYSQYRAFVYREDAGPAALAFLGFATTEPGKEIIDTEPSVAAPDEATDTATAPAVSTDESATVPEPISTAAPATTTEPTAAAGTKGKGGFPLWLLPLIAIPLLGGLLWWLLKQGNTSAAPAAGAGVAAAGVTAAGIAAAAGSSDQPRMVLTPRDCRNAYAYWEIPQEHLAKVKRQGGETMMVRLYDVTGHGKNAPLPVPTGEFQCIESNPDLHLPIAVDDRSYCAEVGFLTKNNRWIPVVKSEQVQVPVCPEGAAALAAAVPDVSAKGPNLKGAGAALGGAAVAGTAALGATKLFGGKIGDSDKAPVEGRMVLTPRSSRDAYAYWEIPEERLADAKLKGGKTIIAKLYDVTGCSAQASLPESSAQIECAETDVDTHFPVEPERDYIAEVGYQTTSGEWLPLVQSSLVQVPTTEELANAEISGDIEKVTNTNVANRDKEASNITGKFPGATVLGSAAAVAAGASAAAMGTGFSNSKSVNDAKLAQSRIVLTPQSTQKAYVSWEVPETAKSALKAEGGKNYQLRVHDVTNLDINHQSPNSTLTYDLSESDSDRTVPIPNAQGTYLAEVGYQTESNDWLMIARSAAIKPAVVDSVIGQEAPTVSVDETDSSQALTGIGLAGAAATGGLASAVIQKDNPDTTLVGDSKQGSIKTVKVHSRNNAVMFNEEQLQHIEYSVASTHQLDPAMYTLRLTDGVFNYDGDDRHPGEPFVILWIHGGTVVNEKTGVPVSSTWTTLNGYDETLTLDVREPAKLCAFYVDTYPYDNTGEVTLAVTKH